MNTPHFLPYQGSKRKVADQILAWVPQSKSYKNLIEPFAGSAAFSVHSIMNRPEQFRHLVLGESYKPLALLWDLVINDPIKLSEGYRNIWEQQSDCPLFNNELYQNVRSDFNAEQLPDQLLFLAARCVKSSIRFNSKGEFNQSADKRRKGVKPDKMRKNIDGVNRVIGGMSEVVNCDFMELFERATPNDLVYCDPPWLGITNTTNKRYYQQLDIERFINGLEILNKKGVDYMVSFDGTRGTKDYGGQLPSQLGLKKVSVDGGISSQSVLNGLRERTVESLYLSRSLCHII